MSDVEENSAEKRLKIVLVGDSGAGKVSLRSSQCCSLRPRDRRRAPRCERARIEVVDPAVRSLACSSVSALEEEPYETAHLSVRQRVVELV